MKKGNKNSEFDPQANRTYKGSQHRKYRQSGGPLMVIVLPFVLVLMLIFIYMGLFGFQPAAF